MSRTIIALSIAIAATVAGARIVHNVHSLIESRNTFTTQTSRG